MWKVRILQPPIHVHSGREIVGRGHRRPSRRRGSDLWHSHPCVDVRCDANVASMATGFRSGASEPTSKRRAGRSPVLLWAPVWLALLVLAAVVLTRWGVGGVESIDPGADEFAGAKLLLLRGTEVAQFAVFVFLVWRYVVRTAFTRKPLEFDGVFIIVAFAMNFWDPLDNFSAFAFQYNAHFFNVGAWGGYIPGYHGPGPELWAVPLAFIFGCYTWAWFLAARSGSWLLDRLSQSRPAWGSLRRYGSVYIFMAAQVAVSEFLFLRLQHWTYPTTVPELTLWDGHSYAQPIFNPIFYGLTFLIVVWLRESSRTGGLSFPERGLEELHIPHRLQSLTRVAAVFGFLSVAYIVTYFVPFILITAHGTLNTDLPSYFPVP